MFQRKIDFSVIFCTLTLLFAPLQGKIENSVIPTIERLQYETVPEEKLTFTQRETLERTLPYLGEKVRIMSFNMLYDIYEKKYDKEDHWKNRYYRIAELLHYTLPDAIGSQELLPHLLADLLPLINDEYSFLGPGDKEQWAGRPLDGIFYRKSRVDLLEGKHLFTSDTPLVPSENPFGKRHLVTQGHFRMKDSRKEFILLNTHCAFMDGDSREYSMRFIARYVESLRSDIPIFVTGDFNTFAFRGDLENLPFYDGDLCQRIMTKASLTDSREATILGTAGPLGTYTNDPAAIPPTPFRGTGIPGIHLDHIYVNDALTVLNYAVEPAIVDGRFPSDHMPVIVDAILIPNDEVERSF